MEKLEKREKFKKTSKLFHLLNGLNGSSGIFLYTLLNLPAVFLAGCLAEIQIFNSSFVANLISFGCVFLFNVILILFARKQDKLVEVKKKMIDVFLTENPNGFESKITR